MKHILSSIFLAGAFLCLSCANLTMSGGSGTDIPDAMVAGRIVDMSGNPVPHTSVSLLPYDYDPVADKPLPVSYSSTTDSAGMYCFNVAARNVYNIEAIHSTSRSRALIQTISAIHDTNTVPAGILQNPGRIIIDLPENMDTLQGYVYIPGTTFAAFLNGNVRQVVLDSIPAGAIRAVSYSARYSTTKKIIRFDVPVPPGDSVVIANPDWQYAKRLFLNTTASGASVSGNVLHFPVLIRLTNSNFDFSQSAPDGADIRFTKRDNTPLSCEIERWDASLRSAEIWIKVDTVFGNDNTQFITMYWGASAGSISNSSAVFDTASGFQGVWHLNEATGQAAKDATGNHFDGTASDTAPALTTSPLGTAKQFNGLSSFFEMKKTASGKLDFPKNGTYSLSAWVWVDTLNNQSQMILTKGWTQYFIHIGGGDNTFEFNEYADQKGYERTSIKAVEKEWHYVTGARAGALEYLYVDGVCVDSTLELGLLSTDPRTTTGNLSIGRNPAAPWYYFKGKIDEARIMDRAPGADWIKLCYMNQKLNDALVVFP
jgi:hypothetical protein